MPYAATPRFTPRHAFFTPPTPIAVMPPRCRHDMFSDKMIDAYSCRYAPIDDDTHDAIEEAQR